MYTSVDQVFSEPVFRAFEAATGLTVRPVFDTEETKSRRASDARTCSSAAGSTTTSQLATAPIASPSDWLMP